ncbi:MAG TPA: DciA family protein [Phycisphaerae bacterium]|nr:DciA family protein [Phycisphaerae bacterium]
MDDAQLRTVWQQRQFRHEAIHVGQPLAVFMKHTLGKRVRQLAKLAEIWDEVIPESIREHTALESFRRDVLTVIVDSAPHRFQLKTLLSAGLLKGLRSRFSGALDRVRLVSGQFSSVDVAGQRRYEW